MSWLNGLEDFVTLLGDDETKAAGRTFGTLDSGNAPGYPTFYRA